MYIHVYTLFIYIYIFFHKARGTNGGGKKWSHLSSKNVGCNSRLATTEGGCDFLDIIHERYGRLAHVI